MKFRAILISILSITLSASAFAKTPAYRPDRKDKDRGPKVERTIAVDSAVTVSLCVMSGSITVRGWDRNEVQARSADAVQIDFKHPEEAATSIKKLEVVVLNKAETEKPQGKCQAFSDVDLNVPRGATVLVQTRDGDISIVEIASAYAGTQNGDIEVEQVSRSIEVGSIGGSICLKDSSGRVSASSAGGSIDAANLRPLETNDSFEVVTTSGDITLSQVTHKQINTKTVSGNLTMTGPLAPAGRYWFNSFSGDVTLALPANSSFKLMAKVSEDGEIITDFPLTLTQASAPTPPDQPNQPPSESPESPAPPATPPASAPKAGPIGAPPKVAPSVKVQIKQSMTVHSKIAFSMRRISGTHGTGDATISVASFSGTLRLEQN